MTGDRESSKYAARARGWCISERDGVDLHAHIIGR